MRPPGSSHEQEAHKQEIVPAIPGSSDGRTGAWRGVAVISAVSPDTDGGVPDCSFQWVLAFQLWIARLE